MSNPLKTLVHEYGWIHLSLGIFGNVSFFVGSIFFVPEFSEAVKHAGIWLFIVGAFFMGVGSLGNLAASPYARAERRGDGRRATGVRASAGRGG